MPLAYYGVASAGFQRDELSAELQARLEEAQPNVRATAIASIDEYADALYAADVAQARWVSVLAVLLALASLSASAGLFLLQFNEVSPMLALHLALGAPIETLAVKVLLPVVWVALLAGVILVLIRVSLGDHWNALVIVLPVTAPFALYSVMGTLLVVASVAGWRFTQVVRRPELMRELSSG